MSVISAVNSPSFGAQPLSGVKRGRIGPPTSVPTNLPSFRGANNAPGQPIRAPLLVNGNRHDRGTNATIPYSRKVDRSNYLGDIAELGLGDVAFVRRGAPDFELGYGVNSVGRLISLIRLNEELRDHEAKMADNITYANIVLVNDYDNMDKANTPVLERCQTLKEWWLDGVVLSTDEPECYHVGLPTQGFNQVYNIAVAGHAAVNNGFSPVINEINGPARPLRNAPRIHTARGEGAAGMISSSRNGRMVIGTSGEVMQYEQVHYVHAQTFTRKPQMLETFYLALIRTENTPTGTSTISGNYYSFQYLEVTSSQLNAAGAGFKWLEDSDFGSVKLLKTLFGLDGGGKHRLVGLFKLGRVCDTKAAIPPGWNGAPPDRGYRVTLSINIEWFETRSVLNRRLGWPSLRSPPSQAPPRSGSPQSGRPPPLKRQNTVGASASGPPPDLIAAAPTSTSAAPPAAAAPAAPSAPAAPTSTSATSAVPSMLPPAPPKLASSAPPKRAATPKRTAAAPAAAPAAAAPAAAPADKPELSSVARRARAAAEAISPAGALSSIFGGAAAGSLEPLQAAHRERSVLDRDKPEAKSSDADGSTGRSFVRRGRSEK